MRPFRFPSFPRSQRAAVLLGAAAVTAGLAMTAVVAGASTGGSSPGPWRAGEGGLLEAPLSAVDAAARIDRAARTGTLLGLPVPARRSATRVIDRFAGRTYDEVTEFDGHDRLVSLQRFDPDGRLLAAVRFGWSSDRGPALRGVSDARSRAERLARVLDLSPSGTPRVVAAPSNGGWTVAWDRTAGGVPVPGDGLRIQLWPDGSVHGVSRTERVLALRPATLLADPAARQVVETALDAWFAGAARSQIAVTGIGLAWVAPNDTFAPAGPDGLASTLRLAWVARASATGSLAESLRGLEVYVDAGDGSIIGGDVLR